MLSVRELLAPASTDKPGTTRQEILRVLNEHVPEALSVQALAEELPELGYNNIQKTLQRLVEERQIEKSARGQYIALSEKGNIL